MLALWLAWNSWLAAAVAAPPPYPLGHYQLRSYGTADGLTSDTVQQLIQDAAGFIWVGTQDGVYRYDGHRFEGYGLAHGLSSTSISSLHVDADGTLLVGTRASLSHWNGSAFDSISRHQGLPEGAVLDLDHNELGLWAAVTGGVYLRSATTDSFALVPGWGGGEATALSAGAQGMWVAQWQKHARIWRYRDQAWTEYPAPPELTHERIDAIVEDSQGRVFARTARSLLVLAPEARAFVELKTPRPLISTRGSLALGSDGVLWVSTDQGVLRLDGDRWTIGLRGELIASRAVLEDREGSLWFGSAGLHRVLGRGVFHTFNKGQGLPGNVSWSFLRDRNEQFWVGTDGGLARQVGERFETVPGTELHTVRSIVEAADGSFYMAGIPANDVLHFDPRTQALKIHPLAPDSPAKRIFRLLLDPDGTLWASTEGAGLLRADTRAPNLTFARVELPGGSPGEYISDIHRDARGRFWLAGQYGLALLENGKWRRFGERDGLRSDFIAYARTATDGDLLIVYFEPRGFARATYVDGKLTNLRHYDRQSHAIADKIFLIGEDRRQRLWIGGGRGIDLIDGDHVEHFGYAEGLLGEDSAGMAFFAEENGDVWLGAVGGLVRFDAELHARLPVRAPPKTALLGVSLGRRMVSPQATGSRVEQRNAAFSARFAGMSFLSEGQLQYRTQLHGLEAEPTISDDRESRYAGLAPGSYRFEVAARAGERSVFGPDASFSFVVLPAWWQTWWFRLLLILATIGVLVLLMRWRFTSLHRQNMLLEARVASRTGEVSQVNRALVQANIQLQDQIAVRVAAEAAVQQRNAELEALNERLAGTQNQLLQSEKMASVGQLAAGVAHEINNPVGYVRSNLGTLRLYLQDIFTLLRAYEPLEKAVPPEHPELRKMLAIKSSIDFDYVVSDTDNLLQESREGLERVEKIVRDLKDFSHLDAPEWQLADVHQVLESTLNVVAHELKYKVELFKEYAELPRIRCLPFQVNQVFMNLLINAVHAIEHHGRITIRTGADDSHVWVAITDTGKGMEPATVKRIFEPFFTTKPVGVGTGLGLSVSWNIVQTHGGRIDVLSECGVGTTFTVHLPIDQAV